METVREAANDQICANMGQDAFDADELALLNEHIDVIYVTVLPNLAMRLAPLFNGTVIFRPFGHGHLNNYTRVAEHFKADLSTLAACPKTSCGHPFCRPNKNRRSATVYQRQSLVGLRQSIATGKCALVCGKQSAVCR